MDTFPKKPSQPPEGRGKIEALLKPSQLGAVFLNQYEGDIRGSLATSVDGKKLKKAIETELAFARTILEAFKKWYEEGVELVLWDIDGTMTQTVYRMGRRLGFKMRPSLPYLLNFLKTAFPSIEFGILSDRKPEFRDEIFGLNGIGDSNNSALADVENLFNHNHFYTADLETIHDSNHIQEEEFEELQNSPSTTYPPIRAKATAFLRIKSQFPNCRLIDDLDYSRIKFETDNILNVGTFKPGYLKKL